MMTSTFPGSRSGSSQSLKVGIQEIQYKRDALLSLEAALKRRINEFKELCLKEGELTGQLPIDYPLQPREPIPQVRRRTDRSSSNLNDNNRISPPSSVSSYNRVDSMQLQPANAISSNSQILFPPRPMSTNSTNSSISTSSSNTRNMNQQFNNVQQSNMLATPTISSSSSHSNSMLSDRNVGVRGNHQVTQYDYSSMQSTCFKKPLDLPSVTCDRDIVSHMRASSTASSSSSSSGSAASSTLSAATIPSTRLNNNINLLNMHARSCSESMNYNPRSVKTSGQFSRGQVTTLHQKQQVPDRSDPIVQSEGQQPMRPPRGINHQQMRKSDSVDNCSKNISENNYQMNVQSIQKTPMTVSTRALQSINIDVVGSFQPFYEETKPFQMSDFYKYSAKHRQKAFEPPATITKTTRQLQEDVAKKNSIKFSSCDDQIQASVKLIEKSGQKLIAATAKAIAVNPGLADKINSILPNNGSRH